MLRANQAVRLGLRAASRNPELAFGRALLDQLGNLLALLPVLLFGVFAWVLVDQASLFRALRGIRALQWPTLGGILAATALAFAAGMLFWSGALPLIAADEEMDRRPPSGNFALLASRGFARVLLAGVVSYGLSLLFALACVAALFGGMRAALVHPRPAVFVGAALVGAVAIAGSIVLDLLGRLLLIRAAAFGEGVSAAFGKAASLVGARLGACFVVTAAFMVLDLIVATVAGMLTGMITTTSLFDPNAELLALAPRIAVGLAVVAVFAWLEVGHMGALAALALDAEGLIEAEVEAPPAPPEPVLMAEPVIEALPVDED